MTEDLFQSDPYLRETEARVLHADAAGIVLDRTVFYPMGGGQPGDSGTLTWDGGACLLSDTRKGDRGILHIAAEDAQLPEPGAIVTARLDWDRRHRHMRCHTALHLLSVVIPLPVTGGAIGAEKGRLDFNMPDAPEDRDALETELNRLIAADHPVTEEWITDAELAANPGLVKTMSVKPPAGAGRVRLVRIGGKIDLQPCGGTHVASTAEIGPVRLGKIEKKGKQNRRVSLHLG
ncbi:MAG: alanyl-tRNA editing protein [Pseudomonadota bacterium]